MRNIKTRKRARIINLVEQIAALIFMFIAIVGGGFDFLMWYFTGLVPNWIFAVGMISATGLLMLCGLWLDELEKDANPFWDRD